MTNPYKSIPEIISSGFEHHDFVSIVTDVLDWVPELKHENLVCTHLSASLRKMGMQSMGEVTVTGRRYDMNIEGHHLEAKYHLEGDLYEVLDTLEPQSKYLYDKKGWNSASKAIHDELNRGVPSWFLWMVCVRDPDSTENYIYPRLREKFKKKSGANNFESAVTAAEDLMARQVTSAFRTKLETSDFVMPTIRGRHSALVFRLYYVVPS